MYELQEVSETKLSNLVLHSSQFTNFLLQKLMKAKN